MEMKIYTQQECDWLDKCLALFGIKANVKEVSETISYTSYVFFADEETTSMVMRLMEYNYKRNIIG